MLIYQLMSRGLAAGALLALSACADLDVANPNAPDTERALSDGPSIAAVLAGTYRVWFNTTQGMESAGPLTTMADSYSASWNNFNMRIYSSAPRDPWQNTTASSAVTAIEHRWYGYYSALSSANDVLIAIRDREIEVNSPADTKMSEAGALLMQGMTLGYLALTYDRAFIAIETSDLEALELSDRGEVLDAAMAKIDEAIAIANSNTFNTPAAWTNGISLTSNQFARLANSFAARLLAYYPRDAAENAAVDWNRVASYASNGISSGTPFDFAFRGDGCISWCDELKLWSNDMSTMRMDTRVANILDPSTQQHPWPSPNGNPPPNSPDDRLGDGSWAGPAQQSPFGTIPATANAGTDYAWSSQAIFIPARGQYHQSNIGQIRYEYAGFSDLGGTGGGFGTVPQMLAAENDLLWAEALVRSGGDLTLASTLINNTRVNRGGLPAVSAASGVPALLAAIQYEQDVELPGNDVIFYNRRRIDGLQPLTPRQMPIPAKELGVLQLELYTFGGAADPDMKRSGGALRGNVRNVHEIYQDLDQVRRSRMLSGRVH